jgi:hypothetical protein
MKTFYGVPLKEMNFDELTLLSVDIQLTSFEKIGGIPNGLITSSYQIREGLMYKCMESGEGDYSRERFVNDFNDKKVVEINGEYTEYVEVQNHLCLN